MIRLVVVETEDVGSVVAGCFEVGLFVISLLSLIIRVTD